MKLTSPYKTGSWTDHEAIIFVNDPPNNTIKVLVEQQLAKLLSEAIAKGGDASKRINDLLYGDDQVYQKFAIYLFSYNVTGEVTGVSVVYKNLDAGLTLEDLKIPESED